MSIKKVIWVMVFLLSLQSYLYSYFYGKNKVQQERIQWSVIESKNFDIHYVQGHDEIGMLTVLMAENAYYQLRNFFRQPLRNRIPIIVYSSKQGFQSTNIIYPLLTEGVGGFTESLRNRVALPFDGSYKKFEEVLVHELVHAYINDLDGAVFRSNFFSAFQPNLPFWFSEGLPEYLALGGQNHQNNMYIKDMVVQGYLRDIEHLGGFFAYRLGEAILVWIASEWSEIKVAEYFYNLWIMSDIQVATRSTFGFDFTELQRRFQLHLKREHSDLLHDFQAPWEENLRHTDGRESFEFRNIFPMFHENGLEYVYYSTNKGRTAIKLASVMKLFPDRTILTGERTGRFEDFHFQRNNLVWVPDSKNIVFVSKTSRGDVINFYDTENRRLVDTISLRGFDSIYEIDISPDGLLLAITAQRENRCDIYLLEVASQALTQITDDPYLVYQPRFSPDGSKLAFVSERAMGYYSSSRRDIHLCHSEELAPKQSRKNELYTYQRELLYCPSDSTTEAVATQSSHLRFSSMTRDIYYYDLYSTEVYRVTADEFDNFYPIWASDDEILFITEKNKVANIDLLILSEGARATVTSVLSGIHSFDYHRQSETLIYSSYFDSSWDIYSMKKPLVNLSFVDYPLTQKVNFVDDFHDVFDTHEYRFFGRATTTRRGRERERTQPIVDEQNRNAFERRSRSSEFNFGQDILQNRSFPIEARHDTTDYVIPLIRDYRPRFGVDTFWGGFAYSSVHGSIGMIQLGLSDLIGDHGIGINVEFNGELSESNFVLSYMLLPHRVDYGFALFHFTDYSLYRSMATGDFLELREYQSGGNVLFRYPFNRFFRVDFENQLYKYSREWHLWDGFDIDWHKLSAESNYVYLPKLGYVFDNALYGSTGPMSGFRLTSFARRAFTKSDYTFTTFYSDYRMYLPLSHRFAVANRVIYGDSRGKSPERFHLSGFHGIRGFDDSNHRGCKKALTTIELRYPFIDNLDISFPLPMRIRHLRGSAFADLGAVWDSDKPFQGAKNGTLHDLKLGVGFGPRLNLGFFILKMDIAWSPNFSSWGKPSYYLTINEDF
jgi:Tol biopolymer transport system component